MTDHLAILDASAPSLSLEKAARSYYDERIPLAPPIPDRDIRWRWVVAILAAILLHLAVVTTIDDGFQREKPPEKAPVPVEIVTELPKPSPPPEPKPVEKPVEKPPPQQLEPDRSSGGDLTDKAQGALPDAPVAEEKPPAPTPAPTPPAPEPPAPTPAPALPAPAPEPPAPTAAPALPTEAAPQAVPVPPAASPRDTQQALVPPPIPARKPPAPPVRQVTTAAPPQTPPQPPAPEKSPLQDLRLGEGGGDKYLNALREDIRRHQFYPPTAEMFRITGVATYDLTIDRQGRLVNAQLVRSSGYDLLDKAGFTTIRLSAPFDPVPADFMPERDTIGLTLTLSMGPD